MLKIFLVRIVYYSYQKWKSVVMSWQLKHFMSQFYAMTCLTSVTIFKDFSKRKIFWVFSSGHTLFASSIGARYTSRLQVNIFALLAPQLTPNYACIHRARASQQPKVDSDSRCAFQSLGPTLTCYLLRKHTPPSYLPFLAHCEFTSKCT